MNKEHELLCYLKLRRELFEVFSSIFVYIQNQEQDETSLNIKYFATVASNEGDMILGYVKGKDLDYKTKDRIIRRYQR